MPASANKGLKTIYESIYKREATNVFTKSEEHQFVLKSNNWKDKTILDVGCGEGDLDFEIAKWGGGL
jgi:2-polyprenyl-3-methyl-5-hydroxy-6-metoxy-1,4-benzoquinol methylase